MASLAGTTFYSLRGSDLSFDDGNIISFEDEKSIYSDSFTVNLGFYELLAEIDITKLKDLSHIILDETLTVIIYSLFPLIY